MTKTIELTPKTTKWIFVINGLIYTGIGFSQIYIADSWTSWGYLLGLLLIVAGPLFIIYGIILFSRTNKLIPKIQVDKDEIFIKEDIYMGQRKIDWENVKEITYGPFELNFHLSSNKIETVILDTNGAISVEVKRTIREFAEGRQIKIVGG